LTAADLEFLLRGAWTTAWISAVSIVLGTLIGLAVALLRTARVPLLSFLLALYVSLGRATPLVTLTLFLFLAAPSFGLRLDRETIAIFALTLNTAAFNAEVWRAALQTVPTAHIEAARACGMRRGTIFRRILLPQMWVRALPGLINEMTLLVKASPAVAVIGIVDLTRVTNRIAAVTFDPVPPMLVAAAIYMALIYGLVRVQRLFEARAQRLAG
jgi:polar amino acid transport system permease protein